MRWCDQEDLVRAVAGSNPGKLAIAAQVTDNSAMRMLDHAERLAAAGAEQLVIAGPTFIMNPTPARVLNVYLEFVRKSPLPVIVYDRGKADRYVIPNEQLAELYAEPGVVMIKDSSCDDSRMDVALAARQMRPELTLLTGDEFHCVKYLTKGYDGLLLGGAIFNGKLAHQLVLAFESGNLETANRIEDRLKDLMLRVYGGPDVRCWMAGLKYLLRKLGLFSTDASLLDYELTDSCREAIDEMVSGPDADGFRASLLSSACKP